MDTEVFEKGRYFRLVMGKRLTLGEEILWTEFLRTARLHGAAAFFLDWYVAGPKNVAVYRDAGCHIKKSVLAVDGAPVDTAFHVAVEPAKLVRPRLTTLYRSSKIAKRLLVSEEDLGPSLETLLSPDGWPGPAA